MRYVLKFGGTSVGSLTSFSNIKHILSKDNLEKLIVVSAASKSTNHLNDIYDSFINCVDGRILKKKFLDYKAHEEELNINLKLYDKFNNVIPIFSELLNELEELLSKGMQLSLYYNIQCDILKDYILSFGERISMYRLHYYLNLCGIKSIAKPSWELGFITDCNYTEASLLESSYKNINRIINNINDRIIITTGYIGQDSFGNITTLGRGGSDLSASLFAAAINSSEIQIWSDVPGIMTCDPRIIKKSTLIKEMTYNEALELSFHGAKILHPKTVEPLLGKGINMRVLNTFDIQADGTIIKESTVNKNGPTGLSFSKNNVILQITPKNKLMTNKLISNLFETLDNNHSNLVSISKTSMSIAITSISQEILEQLNKDFNIEINKNISVICLVGENMHNKLGIASKFFQTITECNVNIEMISQSSLQSNILVAIQDVHLDKLLSKLHEVFFE